jgi:hypothetical protein
MARDGEILNSDRLQDMAADLNIGGVKQYPKMLNLDDVKAVYDLSRPVVAAPGNGAGAIAQMGNQSGIAFAGAGDYQLNLIAAAAFNVGDPDPLSEDFAYRVDCIDFEMILTGAAAIAANLRTLRLVLKFMASTGDPPSEWRIVTLEPWVQVTTGILSYRWALDGWADNGISNSASAGAATWNKRWDFDNSNMLILLVGFTDGGAAPAGMTFRAAMRARQGTNQVVPEN